MGVDEHIRQFLQYPYPLKSAGLSIQRDARIQKRAFVLDDLLDLIQRQRLRPLPPQQHGIICLWIQADEQQIRDLEQQGENMAFARIGQVKDQHIGLVFQQHGASFCPDSRL